MTAQELLRQYYGYSHFRPGQTKVIDSLLAGRDAVAIMPTGAGKSVCFQIPALMLPGITLVVSPLISLMKDQVDALNEQGIAATYINSSLPENEIRERLGGLATGRFKLIYVAPERLELQAFQAVINKVQVAMLAVDEAHCVSQWGHDFRPSYRKISPFLAELPRRPVIGAFTATATPEVKQDIIRALSLRQPAVFVTGFDRPNLAFHVVRGENKQKFVLDYVQANTGKPGIIYAATRREVENLHAFLCQKGFAAGRYHAGLEESERSLMQERFLYDDIRIMVATNAFGMGIDKSNVRYVLHYNMPRSMEAYYQEAGRSGRDGEPGDCYLLYGQRDVQLQKFLIDKSVEDPTRKRHELRKLQDMVDYCHTSSCLRLHILRYFGEQPETEGCENCGNCSAKRGRGQGSSAFRQEPDDALFEVLRQVRRSIAQRERIPPYVVFADSTLKEMSLSTPVNTDELRHIRGVGEAKLAKYGAVFLDAIRNYIKDRNAPSTGNAYSKKHVSSKVNLPSYLVTLTMLREGLSIRQIAHARGLSLGTLRNHLLRCESEGHAVDWDGLGT